MTKQFTVYAAGFMFMSAALLGCGPSNTQRIEALRTNRPETVKTVDLSYQETWDSLAKFLPKVLGVRYTQRGRKPNIDKWEGLMEIDDFEYRGKYLTSTKDREIAICKVAKRPAKDIKIKLLPRGDHKTLVSIDLTFPAYSRHKQIYSGGNLVAMPNSIGGFTIIEDPTTFERTEVTEDSDTSCLSTGVLEKLIFDSLPENLSGRPKPPFNADARFSYLPDEYDTPNALTLDNKTGLIWKRCAEGQTWNGQSCTGSAREFNRREAADYAARQGGWRMPTLKELSSLLDVTLDRPLLDELAFPNTNAKLFWSSSLSEHNQGTWSVSFFSGDIHDYGIDVPGAIRLVR